jgi:hemoglobin/transferrin/lactoferrin receptor protein
MASCNGILRAKDGSVGFLVLVGMCVTGYAQDTMPPQVETLPEIVVTGTRLGKPPVEQPYAFYRMSDVELDGHMGATALDRMNYGPGVFLQRTAPNQASPFIRGLTGEQTLLMLNGVRFSHAMMRPGPNQYAALIPDMGISSVDAILGSSSTVTGSDGLTGALDFRLAPAGRGIARPASAWVETRVDTGSGGMVQVGLDGAQNEWAYTIELSGSRFHDRVGGRDFRDRVFFREESGSERIPNTAYDAAAAGLRLAYTGMQDHVWEISAGHSRQMDAPRPDGYVENTGNQNLIDRYYDPQALMYLHVRDRWDVGAPMVERIQATLWWHQFYEKQFRTEWRERGMPAQAIRRRVYEDKLDAVGLDLQLTTLFGAVDQHELNWGTTLVYEKTDNQYEDLRTPAGSSDLSALRPSGRANWPNSTTVSDGSTYTTMGLFVQDDWRMSECFSLLTGARYSRHAWSFGDVSGSADDITGSLRGLWTATADQRLFAGVSKGYRAPNLTNLDGLSDRGSSGNPAQGNPDLDPEVSYTYETGWRWQQQRDFLAVTAFHTQIDDLIQRDFAGSGAFTNVEGADIRGVESAWDVGLDLGRSRVALLGAFSLIEGKRDIPVEGGGAFRDNISRANRIYGRVGVRYEQNRNWWVHVLTRWHADYDKVSAHPSDADADDIRMTVAGHPDGSMPGYAVYDILCGWRSTDRNRHIGLFVENLADKTYREPGSGTDGVGRSFGLTAGVRL